MQAIVTAIYLTALQSLSENALKDITSVGWSVMIIPVGEERCNSLLKVFKMILSFKYIEQIGFACTEDCHGRMIQEYDESSLHTQLKYLESLFDVPRLQSKKDINDKK